MHSSTYRQNKRLHFPYYEKEFELANHITHDNTKETIPYAMVFLLGRTTGRCI